MTKPLVSVILHSEHDVVTARQRARDTAALLGFDGQDQTRIATAVSEIARNAVTYARRGRAEFGLEENDGRPSLEVIIADEGPGIADLQSVLDGRYHSPTGMGLGILGARRLMDDFEIQSSAAGTRVLLRKYVPRGAEEPSPDKLARIAEAARRTPRDLLDELRLENQELLHAMEELRRRQEELNRLNTELEETNRGVVALYAELDERAEQLKRADQIKSRFLRHVSHEFRTPLTSIVGLTRFLLSQSDGPLAPEQQKQVTFVRKSAESLLELVNDLLDLARVEAGKTEVRPSRVQVGNLFGTLRGMMKPLLGNDAVSLVFEEPAGIPPLVTDESKLAQILRNFVSNALKFTECGEVRVSARMSEDGGNVIFAVSDTGIGIAPENLERIFLEFEQLENPIQKRVRGTGLGLSLAKKLAELLGGSVTVESTLGRGSTFYAAIPAAVQAAGSRLTNTVLIIDDEEVSRYLLRQSLALPAGQVVEAASGEEGVRRARHELPRAILLDLRMPGMTGFDVLKQLKADEATAAIPVVIVTSRSMTVEERSFLDQNADGILSKDFLTRPDAGEVIRQALSAAGVQLESEPAEAGKA